MEFSLGYLLILLLAGIALIGLLTVLVKMFLRELRRPELGGGMSRQDVIARWQMIEGLTQRNDEVSYKLAIMEADKLLDHALKAMYFTGNTLGERLKLACYKYPSLKQVWQAHLMRNRIVHEANYHVGPGSAKRAIMQYRQALKTLNIL